ncbi:MAG TPA: hypothetical protein VGP79_04060 [Bryobacteraceae bacterium]|nr:hypothetical protein [Bryobacteraceae bacterium]
MHLLASFVFLPLTFAAADSNSWSEILGTIGVNPSTLGIEILEGDSPRSTSLGFRATAKRITVRSVEDLRNPKLKIVWEKSLDLPIYEMPADARIFTRERWQQAPLVAGLQRDGHAILWLATSPGSPRYARFPYLLQALADLGLEPPFRSARLWAFFDSSYRLRADPDYLARHWRAAGIQAIHAAAWHHWEPDPQSDEYLRRLVEACHRQAIQVYAWLEFPHVSERFWESHPEWREKTALGQDAHLDWRKLINLANPQAAATVADGLRALITRFDWDGVNLAELYFESLEGAANPARFTPMNDDVRAEFKRIAGVDPMEAFASKPFLDFRADLARRLQEEWIGRIKAICKTKPNLDLVLTHVDDRYDQTMRDKIGADAAGLLPLLRQHDFTFLIEDPATVWHLGPQRYRDISGKYSLLTDFPEKLAIDINIAERYQDVYPLKQQTGTELFALVHTASASFPRVALYFENSIAREDWPLLAASSAFVERAERTGSKLAIESRRGVGVRWKGPAQVDNRPWPVANDTIVWLPPGAHVIEPAASPPVLRILDFTGDLRSAKALADGVELAYQSNARAMAVLERRVSRVEIDGESVEPRWMGNVLFLPRGQHLVTLTSRDTQTSQ